MAGLVFKNSISQLDTSILEWKQKDCNNQYSKEIICYIPLKRDNVEEVCKRKPSKENWTFFYHTVGTVIYVYPLKKL